jgi:hypothetical protein
VTTALTDDSCAAIALPAGVRYRADFKKMADFGDVPRTAPIKLSQTHSNQIKVNQATFFTKNGPQPV